MGARSGSPHPAYHDGASSLGPQGSQHLPLHKEVGEKDNRGYLGDGSHHEGPLWKETWKSNLVPDLGMAAPCSAYYLCWGGIAVSHLGTPSFDLSTMKLMSVFLALCCPLVSVKRTAGCSKA